MLEKCFTFLFLSITCFSSHYRGIDVIPEECCNTDEYICTSGGFAPEIENGTRAKTTFFWPTGILVTTYHTRDSAHVLHRRAGRLHHRPIILKDSYRYFQTYPLSTCLTKSKLYSSNTVCRISSIEIMLICWFDWLLISRLYSEFPHEDLNYAIFFWGSSKLAVVNWLYTEALFRHW